MNQGLAPAPRFRLNGIEAARGIAAVAVVLYHAARHVNKNHPAPALAGAFAFGHAGVDLFFVISGFIILHVHHRDIGRPARLAHYVGRRFSRIAPPYWVALAATVLLGLAGTSHALPPLSRLLWSALLLPSYQEPILGVAWTLQFEVVFYALFAVLICNRRAGIAAFALWLGWILSALIGPTGLGAPKFLFDAFNLEFFAGMAAAMWLRHRGVAAPRRLVAIGAALFAAACAAEDTHWLNGYAPIGRLAYGSAAALIVLGAAAADQQLPFRVPAWLRQLGAASYSIYLFQLLLIGLAWKLVPGAPALLAFTILVACAVAGGVIFSRCVEYPLTRLVRQEGPHRAGSAPP